MRRNVDIQFRDLSEIKIFFEKTFFSLKKTLIIGIQIKIIKTF